MYPFNRDVTESLDVNELNFTRRALKDASMCIGWIKIFYIPIFTGVCLLVDSCGEGKTIPFAITLMTVISTKMYFVLGVIIIIGASQEYVSLLSISLWMFIYMATYDVILGLFGCIYFMVKAKEAIHYIVGSLYLFLAISVFPTIFHDMVLVHRLRIMAMRLPVISMDEY